IKLDGLTLVPTKIYFKDGKVKIEIGLARGKKNFDKRDTIKERQSKREVERAVKFRNKYTG
ncbi:MAG: SsrA-binding protein, partial [Clostridiales bacterium]|nr:SsrA-binding protein [Clostridiales bacterium]